MSTIPVKQPTWAHWLAWLLAINGVVILGIKYSVPISDYDLWWHMAIGRHILDTGQLVVNHAIFTWTLTTAYFTYNTWIADCLLYLIYYHTGSIGIFTLKCFAYIGFFALAVYFALRGEHRLNPLIWVIISLGMVLAFVAQIAPLELFSFVFMYITVFVYFFIRAIGAKAWAICYLFPIIAILWVNSHGAFILSAAFFLSISCGEILNIWFGSPKALPAPLRIHFFIALALCLPALLLNPYGYELPLNIISGKFYSTSELETFAHAIGGWEPTSAHNVPPYYAIDYLLAAMAIYVILIWQPLQYKHVDWVAMLAFLAYSFLYVKFTRATYFLAPVFVFISLDLLTYQENRWIWPQALIPKLMIAVLCVLSVGIIDWRGVDAARCADKLWTGSMATSMLPVEEAEYIRQVPKLKKLGNTYNESGYFLYQLWPTNWT